MTRTFLYVVAVLGVATRAAALPCSLPPGPNPACVANPVHVAPPAKAPASAAATSPKGSKREQLKPNFRILRQSTTPPEKP
jgi:hypothetical protein